VLALRCEYCGNEVAIKHTVHVPSPQPLPQPRRPIQQRPIPRPAPRRRNVLIALSMTVAVMGLMASGAVYSLLRAKSGSGPGGGGHVPFGEHMQWQDGKAPMTADVDGDGVEDVIGLYRVLDGGQTNTHLGAFSGKSWDRLWSSAPLGDAHTLTLGSAGDAILIGDDRGLLRVLDRSRGVLRHSLQLSDRAKRICAPADDSPHAWIEVADESHVLVSLVTGRSEPAPAPWGCAPRETGSDCSSWELSDQPARAECMSHELRERLAVPGMTVSYALRQGDHVVGLGYKQKGTSISMIAGLEPPRGKGEKQPLWVRTVNPDSRATSTTSTPQVADIADGTLFVTYLASDKQRMNRLAAIDAATGKTVWDVPVPRSEHGSGPSLLVITSSRVYVPHWTWLDVFDVATGKHLATIGRW
jgi:outer membrane protein assembly factor BamB